MAPNANNPRDAAAVSKFPFLPISREHLKCASMFARDKYSAPFCAAQDGKGEQQSYLLLLQELVSRHTFTELAIATALNENYFERMNVESNEDILFTLTAENTWQYFTDSEIEWTRRCSILSTRRPVLQDRLLCHFSIGICTKHISSAQSTQSAS